jgi:hypothetical protein
MWVDRDAFWQSANEFFEALEAHAGASRLAVLGCHGSNRGGLEAPQALKQQQDIQLSLMSHAASKPAFGHYLSKDLHIIKQRQCLCPWQLSLPVQRIASSR